MARTDNDVARKGFVADHAGSHARVRSLVPRVHAVDGADGPYRVGEAHGAVGLEAGGHLEDLGRGDHGDEADTEAGDRGAERPEDVAVQKEPAREAEEEEEGGQAMEREEAEVAARRVGDVHGRGVRRPAVRNVSQVRSVVPAEAEEQHGRAEDEERAAYDGEGEKDGFERGVHVGNGVGREGRGILTTPPM